MHRETIEPSASTLKENTRRRWIHTPKLLKGKKKKENKQPRRFIYQSKVPYWAKMPGTSRTCYILHTILLLQGAQYMDLKMPKMLKVCAHTNILAKQNDCLPCRLLGE